MKIAIDCRMLNMSGIGVFLQNILIELIKDKSHKYFLFGNKTELAQFYNESNCTIIICDIPIFSFKEFFKFPIDEINKCDVFYSPNYNIPFGIKIPIYVTIHDVVFLDVDGLTSMFGKLVRKLVIKRAIYLSKKIFTVSQFSAGRIKHHFTVNKPILKIGNSLKQSLIDFKIINENNIYNFKYILYVGNIKKHKGLKYLIDSFEILNSKNVFNYKLVIVGSSENFKSSDNEVIKLLNSGLNDKIIFTGKLNDIELYEIISHASVLVQPSLYEGFGIPPLEALYLGCEVVLSDIDVFKEIYQNLPVNFFAKKDSKNLSETILFSITNKLNLNVFDTQQKILNQFSAKQSVQILLDNLQ